MILWFGLSQFHSDRADKLIDNPYYPVNIAVANAISQVWNGIR
jgi:hypothetical protein